MALAINNINPKLELNDEGYKGIQKKCIEGCNLQIKNEQRSWTKIVSDNKVIIINVITTVASLALAFGVLSYVSTNVKTMALFLRIVALPLVIVPLLYGTHKIHSSYQGLLSLEKEASSRLKSTQDLFRRVLDECIKITPTEKAFINDIKYEPQELFFWEEFSYLEELEKINKTITEPRQPKDLVKTIFIQIIKDYNYLNKISTYRRALDLEFSTGLFLISEHKNPLFSSRFSSTQFFMNSLFFATGIIGGNAVYNCIKHWNDGEIGKDTFKEALPKLNRALEIPEEQCAYV